MALLKKLKSLFGLDDGSQSESSRDVGVTVEKERQAGATAEGDDGGSTAEHTTDEPTDEAADETTEPEPETDETTEPDEEESDPVQEIKGIGPAYADRLGAVGIETIADLADADPEHVAAETDISETRVTEWVKRAKARS
ncbi:helix-hairpin-helix domain-containing protein [Haloarchaeobius iranensis]|uniref:Helix-hairpin-helix domain-containing protein n=1 Tax=Haloarchaeobius iranensis TaxID=996166 RepID=A0A1G9TCP5_9EURY|nr:helix-hairpin-helix domain-containing protein [Haloarchaeobius iranensis]SDM45437.1 Helix-hairpin-helix domain-containing protein [Haloarchaeobius iranensis]